MRVSEAEARSSRRGLLTCAEADALGARQSSRVRRLRDSLRFCATALLLSGAGCSSHEGQSAVYSTDVAVAVGQRFDSLVVAISRLDVDSMLSAYAEDSALTRSLDGRLLRGRTSVEQDFRAGFGAVRRIDTLVIQERHLRVLGPGAAVMTVQLREAFTDTAGARTAVRGTWMAVWNRQPSGWRIVQDAAVHVPDRAP